MLDHVFATGDQLRWAADVEIPPLPNGRHILIAGMGGSGMAARVGALTSPGAAITVHQGYDLPEWSAEVKPLVVAVSYSGNTEETLSVVSAARELGLSLVAITTGGALEEVAADVAAPTITVPGGLQPRAALAYQAGAVARVLGAIDGVGDVSAALGDAAALVDRLLGDGSGPAVTLGRDLADGLFGRIGVIYGGYGLGSVAAARWKTQINENAKMPAFASEVPELDHNEIEGWGALPELGVQSIGLVMLRDPAGHPRIERRMVLTAEVIEGKVTLVGEVVAQGNGPLERFFSLTVVGDVLSVALAERAELDPTPVALLEEFKRRLKED